MQTIQSPTILVAPLHWGLGHATRCIPLIQGLERLGCRVILASDGAALDLLKAEFPHLPAILLPAYRIRYRTKNMVWNIAYQLPRIVYTIYKEHQETARMIRKYNVSGIISDNRYGCYHAKVNSVLLSHQIHLRMPNAALQWGVNGLLHRALRKFNAIWIPDNAQEPNLSAELSHPPLTVPDTEYIGVLSRFCPDQAALTAFKPPYKVAVILSGPEPQRSNLEQILLKQALELPHDFVLVQGKTHAKTSQRHAKNIEVVSYLTTTGLEHLLQNSQVVVCRSGYSSLMDLAAMGGKKAILIPTPGQTEQEYLGDLHAKQGRFICQNQAQVDLKAGLDAIAQTTGFLDPMETQAYFSCLKAWLQKL